MVYSFNSAVIYVLEVKKRRLIFDFFKKKCSVDRIRDITEDNGDLKLSKKSISAHGQCQFK